MSDYGIIPLGEDPFAAEGETYSTSVVNLKTLAEFLMPLYEELITTYDSQIPCVNWPALTEDEVPGVFEEWKNRHAFGEVVEIIPGFTVSYIHPSGSGIEVCRRLPHDIGNWRKGNSWWVWVMADASRPYGAHWRGR
jgi:hypothetical protein